MSTARHHMEWISLLDISGPFLSLPVLMRAFPQGLDPAPPEIHASLRLAYEEWLDNQKGLHPEPDIHRAWISWVLQNILHLPPKTLLNTPPLLSLIVPVAETRETLTPDLTLVDPDEPNRVRLLINIYSPSVDFDQRLPGSRWNSSSPATRMMTLLHASGVRLGLVTNGERWMLVDAPLNGTTGLTSWYTALWLEEPLTLRAFCSLLGAYRFFGVPEKESLPQLLEESTYNQQEVTDQLGRQVREAVEVLIHALDQADQDTGGKLLEDLPPQQLYEASLKIMMRLVLLLCAEERGILPLDDPFYNQSYAISTLQTQLREIADQFGEEILERNYDAWSRLLAAFRAVHSGIRHDRLPLPAYGGNLFDPDALPFLEGRSPETGRQTTGAVPLPIDNRTVLQILEALQILQVPLPGGPAEARRLSFRALDIEQIGHVYEGLLDHTADCAAGPVLGLLGAKGQEPLIPLSELEDRLQASGSPMAENFILFLQKETGRSETALRKALESTDKASEIDSRLRLACGTDTDLLERIRPFAGLLRETAYHRLFVIRTGRRYVKPGTARRTSGTHYTPRALTEPIVRHTLEPQVYRGPAEGLPPEKWTLHSPEEILSLRVCDMAMGSGAFLVEACRYLAEHLVESWEIESAKYTLNATLSDPCPALREATSEKERKIVALRLIADRCLYGVDKNPMAVEMAKLSLWLITVDRGRPFTFLDHALKSGDSIVGLGIDQLTCWNLEGKGARKFDTLELATKIEEMVKYRREIAATPVMDIRDLQHKAYLLAQSEREDQELKHDADLLISTYYNLLPEPKRIALRNALLQAVNEKAALTPEQIEATTLGELHPFHWEFEFPEVFSGDRPGFDAFIGNPPFIGGLRIRGAMGENYLQYLKTRWNHARGLADYSAFFFLRAFEMLRPTGTLGLIATNTIAQGDTRELGLEHIHRQGGIIYRAVNNRPWPGMAAVAVDIVHISRKNYSGEKILDERKVVQITPLLDDRQITHTPFPLKINEKKSFQGSNVLGLGFTMTPKEAQSLIAQNPHNAEVLFPYLNGEDLNSQPDQSPSRWVINFFDWSLEKAEQYPDCMAIVKEKVYPERQQNNNKQRRETWWRFTRPAIELYEMIAPLKQVLVCPQTTKYLNFVFIENGWVYSHKIIVFALNSNQSYGVLQSSFHDLWARKYCSTLETRLSYTPSDGFETFPFPAHVLDPQFLETVGEQYHEHRRQIMLTRQEGLTATYNRFHNPRETAADITRLRELHIAMDQAVASAYGWIDLDLGHSFHETPQGVRYTLSEPARREILDRLLALNHLRHEEEVRAQAMEKPAGKKGRKSEPPTMERLF